MKKIKRYLDAVPDLWWFKKHGGQFGPAGIPDIIICYGGRFIAFEGKRVGRAPTPLQESTMRKIQAAGGHASAAYTLEEIQAVIEPLRKLQSDC